MEQDDAITADQPMLVSTFLLGDAVFGLDTARVQEVVRVGDIAPVRGAAPFVLGIMNLRGRIATVIDLALKLGIPCAEVDRDSRIFIVDWRSESVGLVVDRVADVIEVDRADLAPPPENLRGVRGRHLMGVSQVGGHLTALLDLEAVLAVEAEDISTSSVRN